MTLKKKKPKKKRNPKTYIFHKPTRVFHILFYNDILNYCAGCIRNSFSVLEYNKNSTLTQNLKKIRESVIATQRAFHIHFILLWNDTIPDWNFKLH